MKKEPHMDAITKEFVAFAEHIGDLAGRDALESKLTSILFIEPREVAMDDLAKMTGYSLPSVCNKARQMEHAGLIIRKTKPGTKKIYLYMEKDSIKVIRSHIQQMQYLKMKLVKEKLPRIIAKYKGKADQEKIATLEHHLRVMIHVDAIIDRMLKEIDQVKA